MTINSPEPDKNLPPIPGEEIPSVSPEDPIEESAAQRETVGPDEPLVLAEEGTPEREAHPTPIPMPDHLLSEEERAIAETTTPDPTPGVPTPGQQAPREKAPGEKLPGEHAPSERGAHRAEFNAASHNDPSRDDASLDDAALAQERARRFGVGRQEEPALHSASTAEETQVISTPHTSAAAASGYTPPPSEQTTVLPTAPSPITDQPAIPPPSKPRADLFAGLEDMPASRAAAHWWVILATLVFTPLAWFLISDAGQEFARTVQTRSAVSIPAMVQLIGGLIALFVVFLAARWSSVGPIIVGTVSMVLGGAFLVVPEITTSTLVEYHHVLGRLGQLGQSIYDQLVADGFTGRLFAFGLVLTMAGVISHGARRQGRREERRRIALEL